jgi:hypothetical protein
LKIKIDVNAGIGLVPDTIDLAELIDPFHVWETADAALAANQDRISPRAGSGADLTLLENNLDDAADALEEQFTTWMDADAAETLGLVLIKRAADLRSLQNSHVRSLRNSHIA